MLAETKKEMEKMVHKNQSREGKALSIQRGDLRRPRALYEKKTHRNEDHEEEKVLMISRTI